jgi:heme-degrading monooxygenase HmoA
MRGTDEPAEPVLQVLAEFVFSEEGEAEFRRHVDRTLREVRSIPGCLQAVLWHRPGRRYQFSTLWSDPDAVSLWVNHEFHQQVLMPGFRVWCTEGCFGEYRLANDHPRARRCAACGRWGQGEPGWRESLPASCGRCGAELAGPSDPDGVPG